MNSREPDSLDYDEPTLASEIQHLKTFFFVLLRYRWLIAAVVVGALALASIGTLLQTPLYRASALLRVDRGNFNLVEDITEEDRFLGSREFYGTQRRILTSRTLARRTMDRLDLWSHELFQVADDGEREVSEKQIDRFVRMLGVAHVRDTQLLDVAAATPDPELSRELANAHAREYIAYLTDAESGMARSTSTFISEQIEKLQRDIQKKEALLREYGEQQDVALEQNDDLMSQQLSELHHELTLARSELAKAEARYQSLTQSEPSASPDVYNNPTLQSLRQQLSTLQKEYAELGTRFEPRWPEMQRKQRAIEETENRLELETRDLVANLLESTRAEASAARNRVRNLEKTLEVQRRESRDVNARTSDYDRIRVDLENQREMLQNLSRREGETGLSAELEERQNIQASIVEDAIRPVAPFKPSLVVNLLLGTLVALVLAPALSLFLNYWDTSVHNVEDLRRYAAVPCLAMIPHFARRGPQVTTGAPRQLTSGRRRYDGPSHALATSERALQPANGESYGSKTDLLERFKFLRNALLLSTPGKAPKVVLVTSGSEREGKSFVASNFAASFAQLGKRVLLIDADLRRPSVHNFFGLKNHAGLTNVIIGQSSLEDGCVKETNVPNLYVLLAGPQSPSPAELLSSDAMNAALEKCQAHFDMVVIDSAPLFPVVDTHALARLAESSILVVRSGSTKGPAVRDAMQLLTRAQAKVAGIVLNDIDLMDFAQSYYYRHYSYSYAPQGYQSRGEA